MAFIPDGERRKGRKKDSDHQSAGFLWPQPISERNNEMTHRK